MARDARAKGRVDAVQEGVAKFVEGAEPRLPLEKVAVEDRIDIGHEDRDDEGDEKALHQPAEAVLREDRSVDLLEPAHDEAARLPIAVARVAHIAVQDEVIDRRKKGEIGPARPEDLEDDGVLRAMIFRKQPIAGQQQRDGRCQAEQFRAGPMQAEIRRARPIEPCGRAPMHLLHEDVHDQHRQRRGGQNQKYFADRRELQLPHRDEPRGETRQAEIGERGLGCGSRRLDGAGAVHDGRRPLQLRRSRMAIRHFRFPRNAFQIAPDRRESDREIEKARRAFVTARP